LLPRLYPIVDTEVAARAGWAPRDLARAYLNGGARLLQLRAKTLASGALLDLAAAMVEDANAAAAMVIVNDRADIARLAGATGVHVGQEDLPPVSVREVVGDDAVVGVSTHTDAQIAQALSEPISYLAVGPVFATTTKMTGYEEVGLPLVRAAARVAAEKGIPVAAIGGITIATAASVIDAGATSLAVITDLVSADPEKRIRQYLAALS
jgi:thiamine-phosphate pyrophosphorylase